MGARALTATLLCCALWYCAVLGTSSSISSFSKLAKALPRLSPISKPAPSAAAALIESPAGRGDLRVHRVIIPPVVFLLLSCCGALPSDASPLNPQPLARISFPFFQGWLLRTTDHDTDTSFIFIVGSFKAPKSEKFMEHYVFCAASHRGRSLCHAEAFPHPDTVVITGSVPSRPSLLLLSNSAPAFPLNITWRAKGLGSFCLTDEVCSLDFCLPQVHVRLRTTSPSKPWLSKGPALSGPEGWLGYTSLLPCHYFVHSVGSKSRYSLEFLGANAEVIHGEGYSHIEGNHGSYFPVGWCWSQAISPRNQESFSLVAGKFDIGTIRPLNVVLYLRTREGERIFRTTDLDDIKISALDKNGNVTLTAISRTDRYKVELAIVCPRNTFGNPVYIPTARGFSCEPGAKESYVAVATAKCFTFKEDSWCLSNEIRFEQACLEFGNEFQ